MEIGIVIRYFGPILTMIWSCRMTVISIIYQISNDLNLMLMDFHVAFLIRIEYITFTLIWNGINTKLSIAFLPHRLEMSQ